ncbi:MAG TPA: cytochrome c-type biogenesis CcmF C-terminal domain-containing protein [Haliangiales bacterium]|nr:cytochrome c-type biogenesis CcmF C-terminal domain-containing protein [Haliangiales bacterium]
MAPLSASPVAALGTIVLYVAFVVVAYAAVAGILGHRLRRPGLVDSAVHASWAWAALMCVATCLIIYAFVSHDFRLKYVAHYSDTTMPTFYLLTAYWGGLDGSLMFWVWVLSLFSAAAVLVNRRRHRDMIGYVVATVGVVAVFFLALLLYSKNPFQTFLTAPPSEGRGMNPLLQNYWMVIHPPSLYVGYVGMTVPFAFCIAALASGRLDDSWLYSVRTWVMIPWFFLSFGLILGGLWAYEEQGWGGYWAWDAVENAGLIPWFTATAFLHSTMIQERRGMLKTWNVMLVVITFFLTIFGTFMTRSGVVQSVHAFGQDNELALLFLVFMSVMLVVSFGLILYRLPALRSPHLFDSFLSREFSFLMNNIALLTCGFAVLFITMWPTISEYALGARVTVGPPVYNRFMAPMGLFLLLLMGAGPLLAWRQTSPRRLAEQFLFPTAFAVVVMGALGLLVPAARKTSGLLFVELPLALFTFGLVAFVLATIAQEFWRGTAVRRRQTGADWLTSLVGVTFAKRRKYGGYLVHLGIAVMFFGFVGQMYDRDRQVTVDRPGATWRLGSYDFLYQGIEVTSNPNRDMFTAKVKVSHEGQPFADAEPARWKYKVGTQETTNEVAIIRSQFVQDVYLVLNGFDGRSQQANFTVYLKPLVNFVWIGFGILAMGTFVCLFPAGLLALLKPRRGAAAALLLLMLAAGSARAGGPHEPVVGGSDDRASAPAVAQKLYHDLVCLCGGCARETLWDCPCGFAAQERERVLALLAGKDLSTPDKERAAYDLVVVSFVSRYGGQQVLRVPLDNAFNRLTWLLPILALCGGAVLVGFAVRTWVRRGQKVAADARAGADVRKSARTAYDDKLDEELDDED